MAIRDYYCFEGDNRKFDNVMEAVKEATFASADRGGIAIKVQRAVLYTHSTEPKVSTLTIIQVPSDIPAGMIADPNNFVAEARTYTSSKPAAYPAYPVGSDPEGTAPTLPPMPPLNIPLPTWKPCVNCGRKK